jgi:D-sedoheptulose 7-phosphate isomerase
MRERVKETFEDSGRVQKAFLEENVDGVVKVAEIIVEAIRKGGKVLFFGNGGSAADAQHLAAEFVNRFRVDRRALPAIALTTDSSILTSIANDSSFEQLFARQVEALGKAGDVAVGISTSGTSVNVVTGMRTAAREKLVTVALTGGEGGPLRREADYCLLVPSTNTARVQEVHILTGHIICDLVEQTFVEGAGWQS